MNHPKLSTSLSDCHMSIKKPSLPLSTPAPGIGGRSNPYASTDPSMIYKSDVNNTNQESKNPKLDPISSPAKRNLDKAISTLPFELREKITSIINMSLYSSEVAKQQSEATNSELIALKGNYRKRVQDIENLNLKCKLYRDQVLMLEEKLGALQDDAESRAIYAMRNAKAISRLSSTNRTLMESFELIADPQKLKANQLPRSKRGNIAGGLDGTSSRPQSSKSPTNENRLASPVSDLMRTRPNTPNGGNDKEVELSAKKSEKIRGRLLKVAMEHNRVVKTVESLELKIQELRQSLRYSEKRNRQMQLELDEIREHSSILSGDGDNHHAMGGGGGNVNNDRGGNEDGDESQTKSLLKIDARLNALINRNAFDPIEGIKQMRQILSHLAQMPTNNVGEFELAQYLCNKAACRLFDVECIVIFILQPGGNVTHKYTTYSSYCEILPVGQDNSLAENVLRLGIARRYNSIRKQKNIFYNASIDGDNTIHTKRIIAIPLRDASTSTTRIVGVVHFIRQNNNKFSEVDEFFTEAFGDLTGGIVASFLRYQRLKIRAETITSTLNSSLDLWKAFPEKGTLASKKLLIVEEVLFTMEHVIRSSLKCAACKCFILSKFFLHDDESNGDGSANEFYSLEQNSGPMRVMNSSLLSCKKSPHSSGVVGKVKQTGKAHMVENPGSDALFNAYVDIASHDEPFLCVPIYNLSGEVIACFQAVRSSKSPVLRSDSQKEDDINVITFEESAEWISYQLSGLLDYIVGHIGKSCARPTIAPSPVLSISKIVNETLKLSLPPENHHHHEKNRALAKSVSMPDEYLRSAIAHNGNIEEYDLFQGYRGPKINSVGSKDEEKSAVVSTRPLSSGAKTNNVVPSFNSRSAFVVTKAPIKEIQSQSDIDDTKKDIDDVDCEEDVIAKNDKNMVKEMTLLKEISHLQDDMKKLNEACAEKEQEAEDWRKKYSLDISGYNNELLNIQVEKEDLQQRLKLCENTLNDSKKAEEERVQKLEDELRNMKMKISLLEEEEKNNKLKVDQSASTPSSQLENELNRLKDVLFQQQEENKKLKADQLAIQKKLTEQMTKPVRPTSSSINDSSAPNHTNVKVSTGRDQRSIPPTPTKAEIETHVSSSATPRYGDWCEISDAQGVYYYNTITGEASWEKPNVVKTNGPVDTNTNTNRLSGRAVPVPTQSEVDQYIANHESPRYGANGEWSEIADDDGNMYYYNHSSGETSWEKPTFNLAGSDGEHEIALSNTAPEEVVVVRHGDWIQQYDANGNAYWFHEISGDTSWDLPQEVSPDGDEAYHSVSAGGYTIEL